MAVRTVECTLRSIFGLAFSTISNLKALDIGYLYDAGPRQVTSNYTNATD
jgi:hypothetical protein